MNGCIHREDNVKRNEIEEGQLVGRKNEGQVWRKGIIVGICVRDGGEEEKGRSMEGELN